MFSTTKHEMNDNLIEFHDCFESLYKSGNHKAFCLLGNYSDVFRSLKQPKPTRNNQT